MGSAGLLPYRCISTSGILDLMKKILIIVIILAIGVLVYSRYDQQPAGPVFEACTTEAKICADGSTVGRTGPLCSFAPCPAEKKPNDPPIKPPVSKACYVGGCSNHICSDQPDIISNCAYSPVFACYQSAQCERQATGECGWTETAELKSCIDSFNQ